MKALLGNMTPASFVVARAVRRFFMGLMVAYRLLDFRQSPSIAHAPTTFTIRYCRDPRTAAQAATPGSQSCQFSQRLDTGRARLRRDPQSPMTPRAHVGVADGVVPMVRRRLAVAQAKIAEVSAGRRPRRGRRRLRILE